MKKPVSSGSSSPAKATKGMGKGMSGMMSMPGGKGKQGKGSNGTNCHPISGKSILD